MRINALTPLLFVLILAQQFVVTESFAADSGSGNEVTAISDSGAISPSAPSGSMLDNRFTENGNGTVLDNDTGLMWVKDANINKSRVPWQVAEQFIDEMNKGKRENFGYSNWRLPTIKEIASLFDKSRFFPSLPVGNPFENVQTKHYYWSSSGGFNMVGYVWVADMGAGSIKYDYISYCNFQFVWPVRTARTLDKVFQDKLTAKVQPSDIGFSYEDLSCDTNLTASTPMPPTRVSAVSMSPSEIVISWDYEGNSIDIAWYNIYEGTKFVKSVPGTYAVFDSLYPNGRRCYAVSSYNALGMESDKSPPVCATTWTEPAKGTVWSEGLNSFGQLGDGTYENSQSLVLTGGLKDIIKVATGMEHAVALKSDGTVWAWGSNQRGQLGDGTTQNSAKPVQVKDLEDVVDLAAGWYHSLAITSDGSVWAWGRNYYGQLGDGTSIDRLEPIQVAGLSNVKKIAAGWYHSLAITSDGSVWAWGWNLKGQLGDGDMESKYAPVKVIGLDDIIDIDGGMYHSLALQSNGEVWAWGWNEFGQLGNDSNLDTPFPVPVKGLQSVVNIDGGMHYSLALKGDGTIWAWGRNDYGQLGKAAFSQTNRAVQVKGLDGFSQIAAGAQHAVAVKNDGTLWAWGADLTSKSKKSLPKRISGLIGIVDVDAGINFTTALKE